MKRQYTLSDLTPRKVPVRRERNARDLWKLALYVLGGTSISEIVVWSLTVWAAWSRSPLVVLIAFPAFFGIGLIPHPLLVPENIRPVSPTRERIFRAVCLFLASTTLAAGVVWVLHARPKPMSLALGLLALGVSGIVFGLLVQSTLVSRKALES